MLLEYFFTREVVMNRAFMSDNTAPADIRILKMLEEVNVGFAKPYGNDPWTAKASELVKAEFGESAVFYPVLTGTGANVISLASVLSPFQAVVCADTAHINVDECGAPERFLGSKLINIKAHNGKLTPELIKPCLHSVGFEHHSQPYVISISQVSELGTAYTQAELSELSVFAKENNMILHIDGSRLANGAAFLGCSMGDAVRGADILSFGGTKNGMMMGEAVVFLNPELAENCKYFRKQGMQLYSKMRYVSAQFIPYLENKIWLENAAHANNMAKKLADGLEARGFKSAYPINSNGVFIKLPKAIIERILEKFEFYIWDEEKDMVRFMCSFSTQEKDVNDLLRSID